MTLRNKYTASQTKVKKAKVWKINFFTKYNTSIDTGKYGKKINEMKFVILQALAHLHFLPTHFLMISPMFFGEHLLTTLLANISHLKHGLWNHKASNHGRRCADGSLQPELAMLTPGPADLVRNILHTRASTQTRSSSTLPLLKGVGLFIFSLS